MTKIYIADPNIRAEQIDAIRAALPAGWSLGEDAAGASAILTENVDITPQIVAAAGPGLRLVAKLETGSASLLESGVATVELPNTALVGVAEMAVLMIMALGRRLNYVTRRTLERDWLPDRSTPVFTDQRKYTYNWIGLDDFGTLYGKTAGLIGLGLIGRATATRLKALGMRVLYTQRNRMDAAAETKLGVEWRDFDDLLRESDFVSLHHRFQEGPGGNDKHIGPREFSLMKPTAYLINTARGRLVDEDALVEALHTGRIAGAGLDVFRYEPLPDDSPLWDVAGENVILTPHIAGAPLAEAWQTTARELVERVRQALT